MALQTIDKLAGLGTPGYFRWIYSDTNNNVQRCEWGNTSTDQVVSLQLLNPVGKPLVSVDRMMPGGSGFVDIAAPDRFDMYDDRISVRIAYGPIGG